MVLGPPVIQPKEIQFAEVNSDAGIIECRVLSNPGITSLVRQLYISSITC